MADPSVDEIAKQNSLKVLDMVNAIQDSTTTSPVSPVPKPRKKLSPAMKAESKVTPPTSPMRPRSKNDKPTARRRQKFATSQQLNEGEGGKRENQLGDKGKEGKGEEEMEREKKGKMKQVEEEIDGFVILQPDEDVIREEMPDSQDLTKRPDLTEDLHVPTQPEKAERPDLQAKSGSPDLPVKPERPKKPKRPDLPRKSPDLPEIPDLLRKSPDLPENAGGPDLPRKSPDLLQQPERQDLPQKSSELPEKPERPDLPRKSPDLPRKSPEKPERPDLPHKSPDLPRKSPEKPERPDLSHKSPDLPRKSPEKPERPDLPHKSPDLPRKSPEKPERPDLSHKSPDLPRKSPEKPERPDLPHKSPERLDVPEKKKPQRPKPPSEDNLRKLRRAVSPNHDKKMEGGIEDSTTNQVADADESVEGVVPSVKVSKETTPEPPSAVDGNEEKEPADTNISSTKHKKKPPPPTPPPPYTRQPPPVPVKQRRQLSTRTVVEAGSLRDGTTITSAPNLHHNLQGSVSPYAISGTGTPAISNTGNPAVSDTDTPAVSNTDTPAVSNTDTPAVSNTDTPAVSNTDTPAVSNTDTPAVSNTDTPAVSNTDTPAVSNTDTPAVSNTDTPAVSNTDTPAVSNTDTPAVSNTDTPAVSNTDTISSVSTPVIPSVEKETMAEVTASSPRDSATEHIYEPVNPANSLVPHRLTNRLENAANCLSSGSFDSVTTNGDASVPSSPNVSSECVTPPNLKRGVTVSSKVDVRTKTAPTKLKSRPLSDASLVGSFELIPPGSGGRLEDVVHTLREYDESLQDADIYEVVHACAKALPHITSLADLPSRIPNFPDDPRSCVIHELYSTEYTYVKGLEVLSEVFKIPLSAILLDETGNIFANVDDILAFNKGFFALLHSRLSNWGPEQCIGDIFIGMFTQSHKSMYAIYCSNYDSAELLVTQKIKKKEFEQQLQACLTNPRVLPGLTLPAYLITPVQRIPRYILLLKDVLKRTPEDHPDYRNLKSALERMGELADYIDATVRESQTKKTLELLKNKVHGLSDLDTAERNLVKEGQVYLKNVKKLYQCILFNDMLVFAHGTTKQSTLELRLDLEAVWVEDLQDLDPQTCEEDAIEIYTPERPYTIYTRSNSEKRLWLAKLRETIYHHLHSEKKCLRSDNNDTESRTASFRYFDGRVYTGEFVDSRRHGKGVMTWPNKTVYVGDWVDDERCGEGEFTYNTGDTYRGNWVDNRQNGMGELQYASDDIYRGYWKDGVRHGDGRILYANGDHFSGRFVMGQIEGHGVLKCINGMEYSGEWKQSQRHGKGTLKTISGDVYEGDFRYNHRHGQGTMLYSNGNKYEGSWKNNKQQGHGKLMFADGKGWYEGSWESDLRHGRGKQMYPNGDLYDGGWDLNKRYGRGKLELSTGEVYEGDFRDDMITGEGEMKYSKTSKYHGSWLHGMRHGMGAMVYDDNSSFNGDWRLDLRHGHGELVTKDGAVYRGLWASDKPHGKGTLHIPKAHYTYSGDWVGGKREGRGDESSQYGTYRGSWKNDMKHGYGEEKSLVGTIFEGTWEKNRKHGRGVRKMVFGTIEEQMWKNGQLSSDAKQTTAVELPYISRNDY